MQQNRFTQSRRDAKKELGLVFDFANFPIAFMTGLLDDPKSALERIFYSSLVGFSKIFSAEARNPLTRRGKKILPATNSYAMDLCIESNCYVTALKSLTRIEPSWTAELEPACLRYDKACEFVDQNYQTYLKEDSMQYRGLGIYTPRYQATLPTSKLKEFFEPHYDMSPLNPTKKEFDYACLLAYIAIRSIVGRDSYKKITNLFILSRMDGRAECVKSVEELSPKIQKYALEYWMKRVKAELYDRWGVKFYGSRTRGCYYSLTMPIERLVEEVEKKKNDSTRYKIQHKKYKEDIANAKELLLGKKPPTDVRE